MAVVDTKRQGRLTTQSRSIWTGLLVSLALIAAATLIAVPLLQPHLSPQFGALSIVGGLLTATACAAAFLANRRYAVAAAALQQRDASARSLIEMDSRPAFGGSKIGISGQETAQHTAWELAHDLEHAYRTGRIAPLTIEPRSLTWTTTILGCEFLGIDLPRARPLSDFFSLVVPHDREQVQGALEGARVAGTRHVIEFRLVRPIDSATRHLRLDAETIFGRDGGPAKPCCTLRDITETRNAEEKLRESNQRLADIIDASMDAIITVDEAMRIAELNGAATRMLLLPILTAAGKPIDELIPARFRTGHTAWSEAFAYSSVFSRAMGEPEHVTVTRADGQQFSAEALISHSTDVGRRTYTVILRDISREQYPLQEVNTPDEIVEERVKQRTAELAGVNDALEAFAASIAHELRAPLRTINGFAHLLRLDAKAGKLASLDFLAARILTNGELMGNLLDNLLVLARASHDGLASEPVDMAAMIADVLEAQQARTRATITVAALPTMQADPSLMRMALSNLISNALKYSRKHEHPTIVIDCSQDASEVVFSVRDNGVGFDPAKTDRLFGTFQRLHAKSEFEGTGIGLAIVRRVVELHDGRVWAEGKLDHGATFHFTLPAFRIARSAAPRRSGG